MCLAAKSFALLCSVYYIAVAAGDATFINPPKFPQGGQSLATGPNYGLGSTVDIKWTIEPQRNVSLVLFQLDGTTSLYPYENLANNLDAGKTSFLWTVDTSKNLTFSNNFWICLYVEDSTHADACTTFFTITSTDAGIQVPMTTSTKAREPSTKTQTFVPTIITASDIVPGPITASDTIAVPTFVVPTMSTSTFVSTSPTTPITTPTPTATSSTSAPSGLSTATKAGLGVGASVGAVFIAGAGFLALNRWKKWRDTPIETNSITRSKIFGSSPSTASFFHSDRIRTPKMMENTSGWT